MKTVKELKAQIEITNDEDNLGIEVMKEITLAARLNSKMQDICKSTGFCSKTGLESRYEITNEEILNTLRDLYKSTRNNFVKGIIETVGKSKKFSHKQMDIICDELVTFNSITINF